MDIHADPNLVEVRELLSEGNFKQVYVGSYDGEVAALSVMNGAAEALLKSKRKAKLLGRELRALNLLSNHPNVPKFHGYCTKQITGSPHFRIFLVHEFCDLGSLEKFVDCDEFIGLSMNDKLHLCVDVLRVLAVMHEEGIYHRRVELR